MLTKRYAKATWSVLDLSSRAIHLGAVAVLAILSPGVETRAAIFIDERSVFPTLQGEALNEQLGIAVDSSRSADDRAEAVRLIGGVWPRDDRVVLSILVGLAGDVDEPATIRVSAIGALENLASVDAPDEYKKYDMFFHNEPPPLNQLALDDLHREVVSALISQLRYPDRGILDEANLDVVRAASQALGSIGAIDERAVPPLAAACASNYRESVKDETGFGINEPCLALLRIAESARRKDLVSWLPALERIPAMMDDGALGYREEMQSEITALRNSRRLSLWTAFSDWTHEHSTAALAIVAALFWIPTWLSMFFFFPLAFLKITLTLKDIRIPLPNNISLSLPAHWFVLGFLWSRPRIIDAWINSVSAVALRNFQSKATVVKRKVHVSVPVELDQRAISDFSSRHLRALFTKGGPGRLLITGEGGSGKTSLACQICLSCMSSEADQRPAPWCMLPILIERELETPVADAQLSLSELIKGDLEKLISIPLQDSLFECLLETRRLLVVIDRYSELGEGTRKFLAPDGHLHPSAALLITSRHDERLGDVPKATLKPIRISGDYLFEFVGAYLRAKDVRAQFTDAEFARACGHISEVLSGRDATILLVKLFCMRLIEAKKGGNSASAALPTTVPELVLTYIEDLNISVTDQLPLDEVVASVLALAWCCLEEDFVSRPCERDRAVRFLSAEGATDPQFGVTYIEKRLGLIQSQSNLFTSVRFTLDPLAEYWAALHVVRTTADSEVEWHHLVLRWRNALIGNQASLPFFAALRDCLDVYGQAARVPVAVTDMFRAVDLSSQERLPVKEASHPPVTGSVQA